jgi:hypothetical protein
LCLDALNVGLACAEAANAARTFVQSDEFRRFAPVKLYVPLGHFILLLLILQKLSALWLSPPLPTRLI